MDLVYLGISGVLHPSESMYRLLHSRSPWDDGHERYEAVAVLEQALERWPRARIVLTSTQPWACGIEDVLARLGLSLVQRVVGYTFEDLTTKAMRAVTTISGKVRHIGYSRDDYWRMNKSHVVTAHVGWRRPERWIAVDDEDILWPHDVRRDRLVLTDGCKGLLDASAQDRLLTVLVGNFGPGCETTDR